MDFLLAKLFWYLLLAFFMGVLVGWVSCTRIGDR